MEYELLNSFVGSKPGIRGCLCPVLVVLVHPRQVLTTQLFPPLFTFYLRQGLNKFSELTLDSCLYALISGVAVSIGPAQTSLLLSTFNKLKSQECFLDSRALEF